MYERNHFNSFDKPCQSYLATFVQQDLLNKTAKVRYDIMMIVGQVTNKEEANEITFIAKLFVVGQRARDLARQKKD